jgi:hypothetical protein
MKALRKIIKILIITISVSIGLYAIELFFISKKDITSELVISYDDFNVTDVNYQLSASKFAIGNIEESQGWYVSDNRPKKNNGKFSRKGLFLNINEKEFTKIKDKFIANKLYLVNNSDEEICFFAQDSRLYLKMQAKNILGFWDDIEYIPGSWCGSSYHEVCLEKGAYWEFPSLQFKGRYKTKYRYKLENGENDLYSNEIDGYVNNGQFLNKQKYFPTNLMNPYDE